MWLIFIGYIHAHFLKRNPSFWLNLGKQSSFSWNTFIKPLLKGYLYIKTHFSHFLIDPYLLWCQRDGKSYPLFKVCSILCLLIVKQYILGHHRFFLLRKNSGFFFCWASCPKSLIFITVFRICSFKSCLINCYNPVYRRVIESWLLLW